MKKYIKSRIEIIRELFFGRKNDLRKIIIVCNNSEADKVKVAEIKRRFNFFDPSISVEENMGGIRFINYFNNAFVAYIGHNVQFPRLLLSMKYDKVSNLDYEANSDDGWVYHRILTMIEQESINVNRNNVINTLKSLKEKFKLNFNKAYIFGTGPSLEKAYERSWTDGIRIVSNTIVKDKELWNHINPHFIVAGDAIYHYGISDFAVAFRNDLAERLSETNTYFVFQEHFYPFVKRNFPNLRDRLIPIPVKGTASIYNIIEEKFELPAVGNVLNNLLLPLGCYLCDSIFLWGFDGRAPDDELFWKNSDKHFYSSLVPQLQQLHPAFFEVLVPKDNPAQYVISMHGDLLNNMLLEAESHGKTFTMMHPSYTKTLMNRYRLNVVG